MVWDAARARVVLFGGKGGGYQADTWEWDGRIWTMKTPTTSPQARHLHGMAYDALRQRVVLYGGNGTGVSGMDTWEWDGITWTQRSPANTPGVRRDMGMAYDPVRQRVVIFGGQNVSASGPSSFLNDVWEYDGTNWTQRTPANAPAPRAGLSFVYDVARSVFVSFGGWDSGNTFSGTFELVATTWVNRSPSAGGPSARSGAAMAYDAQRQRSVLFGGLGTAPLSGTWEWDGTSWDPRSTSAAPSPRFGSAAAWDPNRRQMVLFGGDTSPTPSNVAASAETWEYGL